VHTDIVSQQNSLQIDRLGVGATFAMGIVVAVASTTEVHLLQRDSSGGKRQGRYVLGDLLGRGGMAEVFAGQSMGSHGFQKPVAIKRLLPELANDKVFVERLIGEAKLLVDMQHGNIVSVIDLARDGDDVFLVMEFMDGPSVRQLLKARGSRGLPMGVATYIVQNAATGLEFAHNRPGGAVIHADISPSNILLTTSGEVRVADFGIARREGGAGAGVVEGKWAYMAPEQARGEALTPRSDVFALGVVLYELICGQHPLGRQVTADERELSTLKVIPPRVVNPKIPVGIEAICVKALSHDRKDRYTSMQSMIDAISEERFANGWREGANDLATVIKEITPGAANVISAEPRTQHTDRPVTIVTSSLIVDSERRRASSQPRAKSQSQSQSQPQPAASPHVIVDEAYSDAAAPTKILDSGAQTLFIEQGSKSKSVRPLVRPMTVPPIAASLPTRPDGTPAPQLVVPEGAMPQPVYAFAASMLPELASVQGGHTGAAIAFAAERGSNRWTYGILAVAALVGVVAAVAIQLARSKVDEPVIVQSPIVVESRRKITVLPLPIPAPTQVVVVPTPAPVAPAPFPVPPIAATPTPFAVAVATPDVATTPSLESRLAARRAAMPTPKPKQVATRPVHKGEAYLVVDSRSSDYLTITVNGVSKDTPGAKFTVHAGPQTVTVRDDNYRFTCKVNLGDGKMVRLRASMANRSCE